MAGKSIDGDGISASLAGMSKNQLYDIMCQMKTLIEQNQQQARSILIQNPLLTKALFQAQIMLGMVQPPQAIPSIQPTVSQSHTQPAQPVQQANTQATPALPGQNGLQDQTGASQIPTLVRKQHQNPPAIPIPSASAPPLNLQSQSLPSHALQSIQQSKGHVNSQATPMSLPQSSQLPNIAPLPLHSASHPPPLQPPMPTGSTQLQQPLQTTGMAHLPLQPPLPPQPRPPSMPAFSHQPHSQMGQNPGFQHSGAPQLHHSQPMFHYTNFVITYSILQIGNRPPPGMGPSFPQGQPPIPSQLPPQSLYQVGGSHLSTEFNNQIGSSMQPERGPAWMPGLADNAMGTQLPGPPQLTPGQMMGHGSQPQRPPPLTPEMEQALLQQVMSLTPEQINLLPPEQRNQVLQLQQMLRQ
ncbi:Cleavage stimulation factor subunit like [Actinidia chinensis var. chinensis]|uniref:Cleavage stimulation factor subunit like n=2 Tax=Actinidia chinensis var. chinensis TaxID=1590841 RepID=A0A2R6PU23_ACTCC|nr:Cleavage stimulation factor subunit like [Actinidia chinensis var. chinensis]